MSYSYPTEEKEITSIIFDCLATEEAEILRDYGLEPFKEDGTLGEKECNG